MWKLMGAGLGARWGVLLGALVWAGSALASASDTPGNTCFVPGHGLPLRCLTVPVPRDYAHPERGQINLQVTLAPAFRENAKPDPVFVLAGGPGQAGSDVVMLLESAFIKVRATRDIVLIDQRGTGGSGKLTCLKTERSETVDRELARKEMAECLQSLKVDFNDYSTEASARDLDRVRQALKLSKINLWGASYGTRLAQAHVRMFPDTVRSMVLDGVVAPQQNVALLNTEAERAMQMLRQHCEQDAACRQAFPQFSNQLDSLLKRADSGGEVLQFQHPLTGKTIKKTLELDDVVNPVHNLLYSPRMAVQLPWLIMQAAQGNWQPWAAQMYAGSSSSGPAFGLYLAVVCAEDWPWLSAEQIKSSSAKSFMRETSVKRLNNACPLLNVKARPRPVPGPVAVPTLFLSGARD
ncbi:MAG: hypothetical protein RL748_3410, partial [Pseudomonadota bacterium]